MKINSFTAEGVHGYLNFHIDFLKDVSFLVGINGSGKTTVLNLLQGLLTPDFDLLTRIEYKHCELICSTNFDERNIVFRIDSNPDKNNRRLLFRLQVPGTFHLHIIQNNSDSRVFSDNKETLEIVNAKNKEAFVLSDIYKHIKNISKSSFLTLERKINFNDDTYNLIDILNGSENDIVDRNSRMHQEEKYSLNSKIGLTEGLREFQNFTYDLFRRITKVENENKFDFDKFDFAKNLKLMNLIIESFRDNSLDKKTLILFKDSFEKDLLNKLELLSSPQAKGIIETIDSIIYSLEHKIDNINYSDHVKNLLSDYISFVNVNLRHQNPKVNRIKKSFSLFEKIINKYFYENKKKFTIMDDGEIVVTNGNKKLDLFNLSSGESQIIIVFISILLSCLSDSDNKSIYVIDEPELSLHIAWQEMFVESILELSPQTQFILATHSPSIISKIEYEKHCQSLSSTLISES